MLLRIIIHKSIKQIIKHNEYNIIGIIINVIILSWSIHNYIKNAHNFLYLL